MVPVASASVASRLILSWSDNVSSAALFLAEKAPFHYAVALHQMECGELRQDLRSRVRIRRTRWSGCGSGPRRVRPRPPAPRAGRARLASFGTSIRDRRFRVFACQAAAFDIRVAKLSGGRGVTAITTATSVSFTRTVVRPGAPSPSARRPIPARETLHRAPVLGHPVVRRRQLSPRLLAARRNRSVQPAPRSRRSWKHSARGTLSRWG